MPEAPEAYEKALREAVVAQLKGDPQAPSKSAILLKKTLAAGPGQAISSAEAVRSAVAGAVKGLILIEADLGASAVALMQMAGDMASDSHLDSQEAMTWAMEGIAGATTLMSATALVAVQTEIETSFMGAGGIFADLCHKAQAKS